MIEADLYQKEWDWIAVKTDIQLRCIDEELTT
jgi:hypothetical protein